MTRVILILSHNFRISHKICWLFVIVAKYDGKVMFSQASVFLSLHRYPSLWSQVHSPASGPRSFQGVPQPLVPGPFQTSGPRSFQGIPPIVLSLVLYPSQDRTSVGTLPDRTGASPDRRAGDAVLKAVHLLRSRRRTFFCTFVLLFCGSNFLP